MPLDPLPLARVATTVIDAAAAGQRLDRWLARRFPYHSRGEWQTAITAGRVHVDDRVARAAQVLVAGQRVTYTPEPKPEPEIDPTVELLYEDEHILALSKSGNLPCHPGGPYFVNTLWGLWRDRLPDFRLLHRLDRETSGVILLAKSAAVATRLGHAFARGEVAKTYLVVVHGEAPDEIEAVGWLDGDPTSTVRKKRRFRLDPGAAAALPNLPKGDSSPQTEEGAPHAPAPSAPDEPEADSGPGTGGETDAAANRLEAAVTRFRCLHRAEGRSLLAAYPRTGRLHQIRATLCSLGYPLVGDKLYGLDDTFYLRMISDALTAEDLERLVLLRQALHAWRLDVPGPNGDREVRLKLVAPPPAELLALVGLSELPPSALE